MRNPASVATRLAIAQCVVASGSPRSRFAAPRRTISRAASNSVAMSASLNLSAWKSASNCPNWRRSSRCSRAASRAGRNIEATAVEPHHRDLEPVRLCAEPVGGRYAAILEDHHRCRLRAPAELSFLLAERQTRGAFLDDEAGDAFGPGAAGAYHRHINVADRAAGDERLRAIEDIIITITNRPGGERRGVRAAARLRQAIAREMRHRHQLRQKPRALLARAEAVDHPRRHVVDREISGGRDAGGGKLLEDERGVEPAEAAAAELL